MSFFKRLFGVAPAEPNETTAFSTYQRKVLPWIQVMNPEEGLPRTRFEAVELNSREGVLYTPWIGELAIVYVVETKDNFRILCKADLPFDLTKTQLHELAVANLRGKVGFNMLQSDLGFYGLVTGEQHNTAAICLPERWVDIAGQLNDNVVVSMPSKELLLFAPESDKVAIENIRKEMEDVFLEDDQLLTRTFFRYHRIAKSWSTY